VKLWRVPASEVPEDTDEAAAWLLDWWRRIDGWILTNHGRNALPDAAVLAVEDEIADGEAPTAQG